MNNPGYKTPLSTFSHLCRSWKGELLGLLQPNGLCQQGRGDRAPGALGQAGHVCWKDEIPERGGVCVHTYIHGTKKSFHNHFLAPATVLKIKQEMKEFFNPNHKRPWGGHRIMDTYN